MEQAPQRSWWGRNWKWVVPLGCLGPVVVCGGGITLLVFIGLGALKSSDAYTEAVERARANDAVKALLGEPLETGFLTTGNIEVHNGSGAANLAIPLSGPKGSATLNVVATKTAGRWTYSTLEVVPKDSGAPIDLRTAPGP